MLTILFAVVVIALVGAGLAQFSWEIDGCADRVFFGIGGGLIGAICGVLVGVVLAAMIGAGLPQSQHVAAEHQLLSLQDAAGFRVSGTFFLGIGSVSGSDQVNVYFYEKTDKGFQLHVMSATDSNVYISEEQRADA